MLLAAVCIIIISDVYALAPQSFFFIARFDGLFLMEKKKLAVHTFSSALCI